MEAIANYVITQKISENNNSLVYRAIRKEDQLPVILKLPQADYPTQKQILYYQREYQLTSQLHLEEVVRSYELLDYQQKPLLVMEDFGGESLKYWLKNREFTLLEILEIAIKIANIIYKIHQQDIVHKDINPSNLVYNPVTKQLKIIDFGIAVILSRQNPNLANPEFLEGTLTYMSPEQTGRMNHPLDYRTDFYAFGVTLYQLLTKQLPFRATEPLKLIHSHLAKQPTPLVKLNADIPPALNNLVLKLMAKNVEARYQSAAGIRADLERCLTELEQGQVPDFPLATQDLTDRIPSYKQQGNYVSPSNNLLAEAQGSSPNGSLKEEEEEDLLNVTINTSSSFEQILDMGAVIKAAKAISGELELDKLLTTFMGILLESAGAQVGYLLLESQGKWLIEAVGTGEDISVLQSLPMTEHLPEAIVNHVIQTGNSVVENNAQATFTEDPYIQRYHIKSLLCATLLHQGKVMGIIYLENNLATGVFDAHRLAMLKVLSSQAVMSITNAKLYQELQQRENQLRQFLDAIPLGVSVHNLQGEISYINPVGQILIQQGQGSLADELNFLLNEDDEDWDTLSDEIEVELSEADNLTIPQFYQAETNKLYPWEDLPLVRALQGESTVVDDIEIHHADRIIPLEVQSTPIFDHQGQVVYVVNTLMDISQRKQAEQILLDYNYTLEQQVTERTKELEEEIVERQRTAFALQQSEAQNRAILQAIPDLMFRANGAGVCLGYAQATELLDVVPVKEKSINRHMAEYLPPELYQRHIYHIALALETGKTQIYEQVLNIEEQVQHEEVRVVPIENTEEVLFMIRDVSDRKQSEIALAESEAQNRALLQAIPDLMFRVNSQGVYLGFVTSSNFLDILPETKNPVGKTMEEVGKQAPPEVLHNQMHYMALALATGNAQIYEQEIEIQGQIQYEEVRVVPVENREEVLFMIRNVSDRKRAEAALAESEAQNRAILQAIPDIMFRLNAQGTYLGFVTSSELLNLIPEVDNPVGKNVQEAGDIIPEVYQRHMHHMALALKTGKTQLYEQELTIQGVVQQEEVRVVPIEGQNEALFMIRDIGDRKQAETNLKQKNQELAATLEELQQTQHELIQSEKMAALGQLVAGVAHEINNPLGAISSSVENISDFFEKTLGDLPIFFESLSPDEQHAFSHLLQTSAAQTNSLSSKEKRQIRRGLTQELDDLDIDNSDTIADTMVDIGIYNQITPLLPILRSPNCSHIFKFAYQLATLKTSSDTIRMASSRAAKIVFALKSYARYDQSGHKIFANLVDGIETVLTIYQNQLKQGVEIIRNYPDEVPSILCYPDELNQVWTNLVHNALQAMNNKGTFTIMVQLDKKNICLEFTDSGSGIPPEVLPKIFDPFFTTKPTGEGSGLGLNIVKKIIDKHDGTISVRSVPKATTFTIYLPLLLSPESPLITSL